MIKLCSLLTFPIRFILTHHTLLHTNINGLLASQVQTLDHITLLFTNLIALAPAVTLQIIRFAHPDCHLSHHLHTARLSPVVCLLAHLPLFLLPLYLPAAYPVVYLILHPLILMQVITVRFILAHHRWVCRVWVWVISPLPAQA